MRVFMTGATGYVGGAVAARLIERGHEVAALVRPQTDSKSLRDRGAVIVAGDLGSLPDLGGTLPSYDVLIQAAQSHSRDAVALDRIAVDVFTSLSAFVIYTSGVWLCGNTGDRAADESTPVNPLPLVAWRPPHEQRVLASGRGAVIRPGCVYGGRQSLLAGWCAPAPQKRPVETGGAGHNPRASVKLSALSHWHPPIAESRPNGRQHAGSDTRATPAAC